MRKNMKKILAGMLILACSVFAVGCGTKTNDKAAGSQTSGEVAGEQNENKEQTENNQADKQDENKEQANEPADTQNAENKDGETGSDELLSGKHHIEINIKDYGVVKAELDADAAPITVTNFINLAKDGFYDGLTFHRIIDGFMIQGGDPLGNGTGGSDNQIKGEFASNGVENNISHVRGTLSMARSQLLDSASSQFFIVQTDSTFLDGEYAGFGTVTEGMDYVDQICKNTAVQDNNGSVNKEDQPVITSIKVID